MVAVEAAACGVLPISAAHSGLAEVSETIARQIPQQVSPWLSFPIDDSAIQTIATDLTEWLKADPILRQDTRDQLVSLTHERWSWEGVANGIITATLDQP